MKHIKFCIATIISVMLFTCSDSDRTTQVLLDNGYSNIMTNGRSWRGCSEDDQYCTAFTATGPSGRRVSGAVGCGIGCGKGCTVRVFR